MNPVHVMLSMRSAIPIIAFFKMFSANVFKRHTYPNINPNMFALTTH